jgi:hypothetical protein
MDLPVRMVAEVGKGAFMMKKLAGQILWLIIAINAFALLQRPLFPKLESPA